MTAHIRDLCSIGASALLLLAWAAVEPVSDGWINSTNISNYAVPLSAACPVLLAAALVATWVRREERVAMGIVRTTLLALLGLLWVYFHEMRADL